MSNWDKLWNRYITTITETEMIQDKEPIQLYVGDLRKVKAEGDKLQKKADKYEEQFLTDSVTLGEVEYMDLMAKAEKWNIVISIFDRDTVGKYHSVVHAIKNEHKLEAIRKIYTEFNEKGNEFGEFVVGWKKILEVLGE